jgi:cysteinyl-tRNA synthetase
MSHQPKLRLYNTLTKAKEDFVPFKENNVRMYVCGPTVYDYAHIGNARPVIVFDVLYRLLRHLYGEKHVTYVRNITDIDDKINKRAFDRWTKKRPLLDEVRALTEVTAKQYEDDVAALGCLPPTHSPRATDFVCNGAQPMDMVRVIEKLVAKGHAYAAEGHVLFHVPSMANYGKLSRRTLDDMIAGARVEVAPYKRDPMDFVLWKPSDPATEPGWDSPWGFGRPGWHIECSAMSGALLGDQFDIHAGGIDLIFPHHENEIAQTCCAFDVDKMASVWMHNGFLQVEGQKMSKSAGNFFTIQEVLKDWPGEVVRLNMLKTHYRQPIDWTIRGLEESEKRLNNWRAFASERSVAASKRLIGEFVRLVSDDLALSEGFAFVDGLVDRRIDPKESDRATVSNILFLLGFKRPARKFDAADMALKFVINSLSGRSQQETQAIIQSAVNRPNSVSGRLRPHTRALAGIYALREWANANLPPLPYLPTDFVGEIERLSTILAPRLGDEFEQSVTIRITARLAARAAKNFAESDRIRDELLAMGIQLKDGKNAVTGEPETTWEVKR